MSEGGPKLICITEQICARRGAKTVSSTAGCRRRAASELFCNTEQFWTPRRGVRPLACESLLHELLLPSSPPCERGPRRWNALAPREDPPQPRVAGEGAAALPPLVTLAPEFVDSAQPYQLAAYLCHAAKRPSRRAAVDPGRPLGVSYVARIGCVLACSNGRDCCSPRSTCWSTRNSSRANRSGSSDGGECAERSNHTSSL